MTVDVYGNVVLVGETNALMGSHQHGGSDIVVVKLDSSGNVLWTVQPGTSNDDGATAVHTASQGEIYVAGCTISTPLKNLYVVKLAAATGWMDWSWEWSTLGSEEVTAIHAVSDNEIYLAGWTTGEVADTPNAGGKDVFVMKLDRSTASPFISWAVQLGSDADDQANALFVDASGFIIVAGNTAGSLDFNVHLGATDAFAFKLPSIGWPVIWSYQGGGAGSESFDALAVDSSGNVFLAGYAEGSFNGKYHAGGKDIIACQLDTNGLLQWSYQIGTASDEQATSVQLDANGHLILGGYGQGGLDGYVLIGATDLFIQNVDPAGAHTWTRMMGTANEDFVTALSLDVMGNAVVGGYISATGPPTNSIFARKAVRSLGHCTFFSRGVFFKCRAGHWNQPIDARRDSGLASVSRNVCSFFLVAKCRPSLVSANRGLATCASRALIAKRASIGPAGSWPRISRSSRWLQVEPFDASWDCTDCGAGQFQAQASQKSACSSCLAGKLDCRVMGVKLRTYQATSASSACLSCPSGQTSTPGSACCGGSVLDDITNQRLWQVFQAVKS